MTMYLGSYLLFNDGIQTILAIAGAYAADTLGLPLMFAVITILSSIYCSSWIIAI